MTTPLYTTFRTVEEIKRNTEYMGVTHFFDADSMRFFQSRILEGVIGGQYFITSEKFVGSRGDEGPRLYTIRKATLDGKVETPDLPDGSNGFQAYRTANAARKAAEKLPPVQ